MDYLNSDINNKSEIEYMKEDYFNQEESFRDDCRENHEKDEHRIII